MNFQDREPKIDALDAYSFMVIAPISWIASFILTAAYLSSKELRKQPGDLILMISLVELLNATHFCMMGYRTRFISTGLQKEETMCKINSYIAVVSQILEFCYNICFLSYIYFKIASSIKKGFVPQKIYHVISFSILIVSLFAIGQTESFGKDPYGICSLNIGKETHGIRTDEHTIMFFLTFSILIGIFLAIFVLTYTKKKLPNFGPELYYLKNDFLNYYKSYIKICIVSWLVIFFSFVAQIFGKDQKYMVETEKDIKGQLFELGRVGNIIKVLLPVLFFFVRIQDSIIRKKIWAPFKSVYFCFRRRILKKEDSEEDRSSDNLLVTPTIEDLTLREFNSNQRMQTDGNNLSSSGMLYESFTQPGEEEESVLGNDEKAEMFMNLLPAKIKESYTRTFLSCICCRYEEKMESKKDIECNELRHVQEICCYSIRGTTLMQWLKTDRSIIDCKFTIYAPGIFKEIVNSAPMKIKIKESLDISKNEENIKKAGESGGGASGELFMFSHDNRLILKTANHTEINTFHNIMLDYMNHIKTNQATMIARILGLFDFTFRESDKSIKLILIENTCPFSSELILRKYDIKGSKFSRRTLKTYKDISFETKIKPVLKDLDFLDIDETLDLSAEHRATLLSMIHKDIQFFYSHNVIDYSLLVIIVS